MVWVDLGDVGAAAGGWLDGADFVVVLLVVVLVVFRGRRGEVRAAARRVGHVDVDVRCCWVSASFLVVCMDRTV
jgi:hypothetical protein